MCHTKENELQRTTYISPLLSIPSLARCVIQHMDDVQFKHCIHEQLMTIMLFLKENCVHYLKNYEREFSSLKLSFWCVYI